MRKIVIILALLFTVITGHSQAPGIFNYQGVARNSVGSVVANKTITLRLTIHDGSASGTVVYSETRTVTTNPFGLFNVQVGSPGASGVIGTIPGLNWALGAKYIQVEIDPNGGSSFINIGTAQLASVPYALYANAASPIGIAGGDLTGNYPNPAIANAAVTTVKLADGAVTTPKITFPLIKTQSDAAPLILMINSGAGIGLSGNNTGTGIAGLFTTSNAANTSNTVQATTNGTGWAGFFASSNTTPKALRTIGAIQLGGIGEGINKVLTSDANGNASWQTPVPPAAAWLLNGNAGTVDGTHFIGSIDNVPFNIRVNNQKAGRIDSAGPTFFGYQAGNINTALFNTGIGNQALFSNTTGNLNTAVGYHSLFSNTIGFNNTATGYNALSSNTEGNLNTAYGMQALLSNIDGDNNTALGYSTLLRNTTGGRNTASGYFAMQQNTTGGANAAYGVAALFSNKTGYSNVAIGAHAMFNNETISNMVAIGDSALYNNTTGIQNTAIGSKALYSSMTGSNNTANGFHSLLSNESGTHNTAIGSQALESNISGNTNTAIGKSALLSNISGGFNAAHGAFALEANISGNLNAAFGYRSLTSNTFGVNNTALGGQSLHDNTTGYSNVAIGMRALYKNTTASNLVAVGDSALFNNSGNNPLIAFGNTAIGSKALFSNTTASTNTALGSFSLYSNRLGSRNTAIGWSSLYLNDEGDFNTAVGWGALYNNTGNFNTALGNGALSDNTSGNNNTALGNGANVSSGILINATAIGYGATVTASNRVQIGNSAVTDVYFGNPATTVLHANSVVPSDKRFKYNVQQNVPGLDFINRLKPVTYYFDEQKLAEYNKTGIIDNSPIKPATFSNEKQLHTGFLAQDVEKLVKELGYSFDGVHAPANDKDHYSLAYSQFIMPLVKAVQEQQEIIQNQQKQIDELKAIVTQMLKNK